LARLPVDAQVVPEAVEPGPVERLDKGAPTAVDDLGACVHQRLVRRVPVHVVVEGTVGLAVGAAGLGHDHRRCEGDAVLLNAVTDAGCHPEHAGPVPVVAGPGLITGDRERLARREGVRRDGPTVPEAGRAVETLGSHRNDQRGLEGLVCHAVTRVHHSQRDALTVVAHGVGRGRVDRDELPRCIDRRAARERIDACEISVLWRLPTGFRGRQFLRNSRDVARVSRV
jgi:hypothetical protein